MSNQRTDDDYDDSRYDESRHDEQPSRGSSRRDRSSRGGGHLPGSDKAIAVRRISWGAIIAGGLIALTVWVMLTLLGTGVGMGIAQPTDGASATNTSVGIAGLVWWIVSGLIAMGVGGYVAARMAGVTKAMDGVLQGVTTWALTSLVMIYLLTSAVGGVVGGAFSMVSGAASAAGSSVEAAAPKAAKAAGVSPKDVKSKITDLFDNKPPPPPEQMNREQAATAMTSLLPKLAGDGKESKQAYQQATKIVAAQSSISQQEAKKKVDTLQKEAQSTAKQAKQTAMTTASKAANYTSMASFGAFAMLLLGLGAGAGGGAAGKRPPREHT